MKATPTTRPYRHLGRRIENTACGKLGRIARAQRRTDVKRGWEVWIAWDDGHDGSGWTDRDIGQYALNRLVPDDYAPDHGPIKDRIRALITRIDEGGIEYRWRMITSVYIGRDNIGIWAPARKFIASAHLWAGQGNWRGEGDTQKEAWAALREQLERAARNENAKAEPPRR